MTRTLWALAGPIRWHVAGSIVIGLLVTAAYVGQGMLLALALAAVFRTHDMLRAELCVGGLLVLLVVRGMLLWLAEIAAQRTAQATKETLRFRLLQKLVELGPSAANARQSGQLQQIVVGGVEAVETYYSRYVPTVFVAILGCLFVLAALATIDVRSALVLVPFVVVVPVFSRTWTRWRRKYSRGLFGVRTSFGTYLLDSLQGIVTLKAFSATVARRIELVKRAIDLRIEAMRTLSVSLMRGGVTGLLSMGGIASVLAWNAWRVAGHELPAVALFMTLFLAREAFRPLDRLEREFHAAWNGQSAAPLIVDLLEAQPLVKEPVAPVPAPARGDIVFDHVTFAYGEGSPALKDVSFAVGEHQRVALVGASGAGKTTVASLLLRFFDPQQGSIRIGGVDVRAVSLSDLRSRIALVAQDTYLFHGTIADNLRFAKPDATDAEIAAAARAAHIDDFVHDLPEGYATAVGERGAQQLSGGQRQRIAIARALLKDAPILILDEATSSVDPASERAIQDALDSLARRRTTIVIAHRLSTVQKADRILVLHEGAVVEHGMHDELLSLGGFYWKLTHAQEEAA